MGPFEKTQRLKVYSLKELEIYIFLNCGFIKEYTLNRHIQPPGT